MTLLNLGCGTVTHPAFVNLDLIPRPGVQAHDLRQGIPYPDASCELVYHATMLDCLPAADALTLMRECQRVLKVGGVLRVVEPDLEQMCRVYLEKLEAAVAGTAQAVSEHEWMLLELYDQPTREVPGGGMRPHVSQDPLPNEAFIYARVGVQGQQMVSAARERRTDSGTRPTTLRARVRQVILTRLLGADGPRAVDIGRFRLSSGQVTYRYFDRVSLRQLFLHAGFRDPLVTTVTDSAFPRWHEVNLDLTPEGTAARPHCFVMEGIRR